MIDILAKHVCIPATNYIFLLFWSLKVVLYYFKFGTQKIPRSIFSIANTKFVNTITLTGSVPSFFFNSHFRNANLSNKWNVSGFVPGLSEVTLSEPIPSQTNPEFIFQLRIPGLGFCFEVKFFGHATMFVHDETFLEVIHDFPLQIKFSFIIIAAAILFYPKWFNQYLVFETIHWERLNITQTCSLLHWIITAMDDYLQNKSNGFVFLQCMLPNNVILVLINRTVLNQSALLLPWPQGHCTWLETPIITIHDQNIFYHSWKLKTLWFSSFWRSYIESLHNALL